MSSRDVRATTAGLLLIAGLGGGVGMSLQVQPPRGRAPRETTSVTVVAGCVTSLIGTALLGSVLNGPGFLATVALHQDRLLTAALFQLVAAFTSAAIAVTLYPVLREHAAAMALGAVAFRLIEGVFYALSAAATMILVSLSGQPPAPPHTRRPTWYGTCATPPAAWPSWPSVPEPRCTTSSSTGHS